MQNNLLKIKNFTYQAWLYFKPYAGAEVGDTTGFVEAEEVISTRGAVTFENRKPKAFKQRFQVSSSSCVAQTMAKMVEVESGGETIASAKPCYVERSNSPQLGMIPMDALSFTSKRGVYTEADVPSQNMGETAMNVKDYNGKPFKKMPAVPIMYSRLDFYSAAQHIQDYGSAMLFFKAGYYEWCRDIPSGNSGSETFRHSVTGVDTITYLGKEYIIIEDSAGTWVKTSDIPLAPGQRAITKEFFDVHCYFVGGWTKFDYDTTLNQEGKKDTAFKFTRVLKYKERSEDVKQMQLLGQRLGLFPSSIPATGYYGNVTKDFVKAFQIKYQLADLATINYINGRWLGPKTLEKMNELYG